MFNNKYSLISILLLSLILLFTMFPVTAQNQTLPLPADPQGKYIRAIESYQQQQKLTNADAITLGYAVALDGNTALIGTEDGGGAFVYEFIDGIWTFQQELLSASNSFFGSAVALEGDTALVGAYGDDIVYAYTRTDGVWSFPPQALVASDGVPFDGFGWAVALSGDSALISANFDDANTGSVYVFTRSGGSWSEQAKLVADDRAPDDYFGYSVSLSGDTALIGAYGDEAYTGSAYVFTRSSNIWTQQQKLTASDGISNDVFGWSVSLDTDSALVGAIGDDDLTGSAYVFTRSSGTWSEQQKLTADDASTFEQFGISVSLDGDRALIGAYDDDGSRGSAYTFTRSIDTWSQEQKLTALEREVNDYFGYSVSLDGDTALIGTSGKGEAYVFERGSSLEVELSAATASVSEGNSGTSASGLSLLVSGGVSAATNTVDLILTDDTATSVDNDYSQTNATITIPAGDYTTVQSIAIPVEALGIVGDTVFEDDESLTVSLSNAGFYLQIGDANGDTNTQSSATITIINDENTFELLTNGSFEDAGSLPREADGWKSKNLAFKDRRKCNSDKSSDGECAFRFKFKGTILGIIQSRKIKQAIADHGVVAGDTLTFGGYIKANNLLRQGKIVVKALYTRNPNGIGWIKQKVVIPIPTGSYDYQFVTDSMTLTDTPEKIVVVIKGANSSGTIFIDDVNLTATLADTLRAQREALPLPEIPSEFRD